ncbi:MAG TPA: hypothetical protein VMR50_02175 [Myxococcota bacterium]|nr:hypothetical protein [Myxococcota bacterium]
MSDRSRATLFRVALIGTLALGTLALTPAPKASAAQSFDSFCQEWMGKLAQREQQNAAKVEYKSQGSQVVGTYTGYEKTPLRCQSRAKPGAPGVGTLVYNELHMRKAGSSVEGAKQSSPEVVEKVEVMEIFRFDGAAWKY